MRRLKRCADPLGLGRRGDGSVDVDGSSTRFGCRLSSTEFLLKSLALLFIVWAFSPGQGHISNSSEVATIATGRSLTTSTLKLVGVTFFSAFGQTPPLLPLVWDPCPATPLLSEKSCSSSLSVLLSACPSLLLNPQLHLPHFSCATGVTLEIS